MLLSWKVFLGQNEQVLIAFPKNGTRLSWRADLRAANLSSSFRVIFFTSKDNKLYGIKSNDSLTSMSGKCYQKPPPPWDRLFCQHWSKRIKNASVALCFPQATPVGFPYFSKSPPIGVLSPTMSWGWEGRVRILFDWCIIKY